MDVKRINLSSTSLLDRFIRPKESLKQLDVNLNSTEDSLQSLLNKETFTNVALKRYYRNNYRIELKKALFPSLVGRENTTIPSTADWPVKPRKKPLIPEQPDILAHIRGADNVECSKRGAMAAIWVIDKNIFYIENINVYFTVPIEPVNSCLKWNESGNLLAVASSRSQFAVFDVDTKSIREAPCPCARITAYSEGLDKSYARNYCKITALIWSSFDDVVAGCSNGFTTLYSRDLKVRCARSSSKKKIVTLSFSCHQTTLLISSRDKRLCFLKFPEFTVLLFVELSIVAKAISWHPWDNNLIAVGLISKLCLMNVSSTSVKVSSIEGTVDDLLFNPESAELLISKFDAQHKTSHLVVMKDLSVVVDEIVSPKFRMRKLFWCKKGVKLGALSFTPYIWNFFGKISDNVEKQREERSAHAFLRSAAGSLSN